MKKILASIVLVVAFLATGITNVSADTPIADSGFGEYKKVIQEDYPWAWDNPDYDLHELWKDGEWPASPD